MGIAGGRPSSSYYFVGSQANHLFYLDPHLTRPAIPLQVPPLPVHSAKEEGSMESSSILSMAEEESEEGVMIHTPETPRSTTPSTFSAAEEVEDEEREEWEQGSKYKLDVMDADGFRVEEGISDDKGRNEGTSIGSDVPKSTLESNGVIQERSDKQNFFTSTTSTDSQVDPQMLWYTTAYPDSLLRTYHCEKIKKMPLSGLDPSMLLGFVCKSEDDFENFVERVAQVSMSFKTGGQLLTSCNSCPRRSLQCKTKCHHGGKMTTPVSNLFQSPISKRTNLKSPEQQNLASILLLPLMKIASKAPVLFQRARLLHLLLQKKTILMGKMGMAQMMMMSLLARPQLSDLWISSDISIESISL